MQIISSRALRYCGLSIVFVSIFAASFMWYLCSNQTCNLKRFDFLNTQSEPYFKSRWRKFKASRKILPSEEMISNPNAMPEDKIIVAQSDFKIEGFDVIVFLHIQNTGGSVFARHMVEDMILERPCRCKKYRRLCRCYRPNNYGSTWFFSRYTTGWKCGVHPDWSELSTCVDRVMDEEEGKPVKRRYFFMTVLRDPVKRFLSEFWHVRQGQSWSSSRHWCSGVEAGAGELPPCFEGGELANLTLGRFLGCPHNLAANRQARMLSDLALVGCYNSSLSREDRDLVMLTSAKNNLHKMSFFGLSEFPKVSQYMFEITFGMGFRGGSSPSPPAPRGRSARRELFREIGAEDVEAIRSANHLDIELYRYAKELLFFRFEKLKKNDPSFENNFEGLDNSNLSTEDWADREDFIDNLLD